MRVKVFAWHTESFALSCPIKCYLSGFLTKVQRVGMEKGTAAFLPKLHVPHALPQFPSLPHQVLFDISLKKVHFSSHLQYSLFCFQSSFSHDKNMVFNGHSVYNSELSHYYGNSLGGIIGSVYMAVTTDVERGEAVPRRVFFFFRLAFFIPISSAVEGTAFQ